MRTTIWCDFDGTISTKDTVDYLLEHYALDGHQQLEQQWIAGQISSKTCMGGQIALLDMSHDELIAALADIDIDPDFETFVQLMQNNKIEVKIVSDGLNYVIETILKRYDLHNLPIAANHLSQVSSRRWQLDFPYSYSCKKDSGTCKCQVTSGCGRLIYIGDGASDFCVADKADLVFAKGKLINYCQQHNLNHYPINGFADVISHWNDNNSKWRDND